MKKIQLKQHNNGFTTTTTKKEKRKKNISIAIPIFQLCEFLRIVKIQQAVNCTLIRRKFSKLNQEAFQNIHIA